MNHSDSSLHYLRLVMRKKVENEDKRNKKNYKMEKCKILERDLVS